MKSKLTPQDLDDLVASIEYVRPGSAPTLTLCVVTLENGCVITGQSNVIDPENYDRFLGEKVAYENARNKLWELEGYAVKRDLHERPALAARISHEVNRVWCEQNGDMSQVSWDKAPEWQKDSAISGVMAIFEDPDTTPRKSHEGWLRHKKASDWKWGEVKDVERKLHPCMVPYEELPPEQRAKDAFFTAIAKAAFLG